MKNKFTLFLLIGLTAFSFISCFDDRDDEIIPASNKEIQDFVWRGLNMYYLYKPDVPALQNETYASESELDDFLKSYDSPETLFDDLIYDPEDRFSVLFSNYEILENSLAGISKTTGMKSKPVQLDTGEILYYVRYILPNTDAEKKGVKRGMLFNRVNGTLITADNYKTILEPETFTIGLADIVDNELVSLEETITLNKQEYTENPVYIINTFDLEVNKKVGYLMYNAFNRNFDDVLNNAFAKFKTENITDLVIDLRYNSGGSVETSNDLASMITGQFNGELFTTQVYNNNFENEERYFNNKISTDEDINSLNLDKVYVITTGSTASASELLIASLRPYIEVVQVGTTTTGKYQGSVTLYDSPNFSRTNINIRHKYAMQPLILKTVNANGFTDYKDGLTPTFEIKEKILNLGELGDPSEPLLNAVLSKAEGRTFPISNPLEFIPLESNEDNPTYQRMYIDDFDY